MKIGISYDGKWPNLCSGRLVVSIDGKEWDFGDHVLNSGGAAGVDFSTYDEFCYSGPWSIDTWPHGFPEELKHAVVSAVNEQVEHGCCGGCI